MPFTIPQSDQVHVQELNQDSKQFNSIGSLLSYTGLSRLLRLIGAVILIVTIYIFLFQGWHTGNDIERYTIMLAQTLILTFAGFSCNCWLNENKSARLFLGLALFSVPVNFAILGGLLYSQMQWDASLSTYPDFANWMSDSLQMVWVTILASSLLLAPAIFIEFRVLARKSAIRLSLLLLLGCVAILIPVRGVESVSGILIFLTIIMLQQLGMRLRYDTSLRTLEGRFARAMLFFPLGIIIGRTAYLYTTDMLMFSVVSGLLYGIFRQVAMDQGYSIRLRTIMEYLGMCTACCIAIGLTLLVNDYRYLSSDVLILVFSISFASLLLEISWRTCRNGASYRRSASVILLIGILINLFFFPSVITASTSLIIGILILIYGYVVQQRIIFIFGLFAALTGLVYQVSSILEIFNFSSWVGLSLLGISIIFVASILERYGLLMHSQMIHWQQRFKSWEY